MRRPVVFLGDAIRAAAELRPRDAEAREALREMLGFEAEPDTPAHPGVREWRPSSTQQPGLTAQESPVRFAAAASAARRPAAGGSVFSGATRLRQTRQRRERAAPPPAWVTEPGEVLAAASQTGPVPSPLPLFGPPRGRALLTAVLATTVSEGEVDIDRVVARLAESRPLERLPRKPVPTLRRGVQLLLDHGPGMDPFHADQAGLVTALDDVLSDDRLEVLHFVGCPSRGAGAGPRSTWRPWAPPPPGTPVLAVTDLGLGGPLLDGDRGDPAEWLRFAHHVRGEGRVLLALVPYEASRWPPALARALTPLHWSERTTVGEVRRALRRAYARLR